MDLADSSVDALGHWFLSTFPLAFAICLGAGTRVLLLGAIIFPFGEDAKVTRIVVLLFPLLSVRILNIIYGFNRLLGVVVLQMGP